MYRCCGKRIFDLLFATLALILLSPIFLLTALAIWWEDGFPCLFVHERVGKNGKLFNHRKFRSMPLGSRILASSEAQSLQLTRIGRWIRRLNVDELPQLWNVLRGEMSLVGPRPSLASQAQLLELRKEMGIIQFLPGLTGWAQVHAYDGMPDSKKASLDLEYIQKLSFSLDLKIIFLTFGYLLKRPPVY